jgi:hypothetical protein
VKFIRLGKLLFEKSLIKVSFKVNDNKDGRLSLIKNSKGVF